VLQLWWCFDVATKRGAGATDLLSEYLRVRPTPRQAIRAGRFLEEEEKEEEEEGAMIVL